MGSTAAVTLMSARSATYRLREERMISGQEFITLQVAALLVTLEDLPDFSGTMTWVAPGTRVS